MMKEFTFSIIVPVYNAENFLNDCITSVFEQSYKKYEIIFIDDGSKDNSSTILDDFVKTYFNKKIKVCHKTNGGQISARLAGINIAESDYCVFLDADDTFEKDALDTLNRYINIYEADIVIFNGSCVSEDKQVLFWPHYKENLWYGEDSAVTEIRAAVIQGKRFNNICFKAIRTRFMQNIQNYENVSYIRAEEDLLMQLPYFDAMKTVMYIPEDLYNYRYNEESITHTFNPFKYKGSVFITEELKKYAKAWKIHDYLMLCNSRFCQEVISALKQIKEKNEWSHNDRREYLKVIACDTYFRKIASKGKYHTSIKQNIIIKILYLKLYFLIEIILMNSSAT